MPLRQVVAHPYVGDANGRVSVFRGPLLYCAEAVDNGETDVRDIALPADAEFLPVPHPDLPKVTALSGAASVVAPASDSLYGLRASVPPATEMADITLVPYYAWANRAPGAMRVWLRQINDSAA